MNAEVPFSGREPGADGVACGRQRFALARSTDHILSFFTMLSRGLGFCVGCPHLHQRLAAKQEPLCFPTALPAGAPALSCRGLYRP